MKVAILYTGALRTIEKTIKHFKQNILLTPDVHVFACIQNDKQTPNNIWETYIKQHMDTNLKSIQWFSYENHQDWISIRDKNIANLTISDNWKNYLRTSGSIIEYYQTYLAYIEMCKYENISTNKYDYIVRMRTDNLLSKPLDFHWLNWSDVEVENRLIKINEELSKNNIQQTLQNSLNYFMATIISDDLIPNIPNIRTYSHKSANDIILNSQYSPDSPINPNELNNYIKNAPYILTIRVNNIYIVGRKYFNLIPSIAFMYGFLRSPYNDNYWFNAENQFQSACYYSGLSIFEYDSHFDGCSLYEYDNQRYFDENNNILNPYMLYCLVRH
jgi:hypothetical protein